MKKRKKTRYIHEGGYLAEVEIALMENEEDCEEGWSPYISLDDARKLDTVRDALRRGDLKSAAEYGKIYELRLLAQQ